MADAARPRPRPVAPDRAATWGRRALVGTIGGVAAAACGMPSPAGPPEVIAAAGRPLALAPVFALARPAADLAAAAPSLAGLPPRPPISLRATMTVAGALDLVSKGDAVAAVVPRGVATHQRGWAIPGATPPPLSPVFLGSPGPLRLVVRRESVAGPRLPNGRLATRDRPFRFAYLPGPWGLPAEALIGAAVPEVARVAAASSVDADGLPLADGSRWDAFETEIEVVTALVDDRADAAILWPEGAALALRDPALAMAATLPPGGTWADGATPAVVGTISPALAAWLDALGAALDGQDALAILRLALPERDPLTLAGAVALRRADWAPPAG